MTLDPPETLSLNSKTRKNNVGLMLFQRRIRCANIEPRMVEDLVFSELPGHVLSIVHHV